MLQFSVCKLFYFVMTVSVPFVNCGCRQSYITLCDTVEDLMNYNNPEEVSEVMIGSEESTRMTSVNLMEDLLLHKFEKMTTLMVVHAIDNLEPYKQTCYYTWIPLTKIIMYGNLISTIEDNYFPVFETKKLSLVNNQIEVIKKYSFVNHNIHTLDLSDNLLQLIEKNSLPVLNNHLKVLKLSKNRLTYIEPHSLDPGLEYLYLDQNNLRFIQDEIFDNLSKLKVLNLSRNHFTTFPKINEMKNLVIFDMSHSALQTVNKGAFAEMNNLELVDLSNNRISSPFALEWIITPSIPAKLTVSLAYNILEELNVTNVFLKNQTLVLIGNPWKCSLWPELKTKLEGYQSKCAMQFYSNGVVPYCVTYELDRGSQWIAGMWDPFIKKFQKRAKLHENNAGCFLSPKASKWLNRAHSTCHFAFVDGIAEKIPR